MALALESLLEFNVFLRSLFVATFWARGRRCRDEESSCRIECLLTRNRVSLVYRLLNEVDVPSVNQESICCINTQRLSFLSVLKKAASWLRWHPMLETMSVE